MNKIACAVLLLAVSMAAQTGPAAQDTAPAKSEVQSKGQPKPPTAGTLKEFPIDGEATRKLLDLGYFNSEQPTFTTVPSTRCAIPLLSLPVPDGESFANNTVPANPSIDPEIISAPHLPPCPQSVVPLTIRSLEPGAKKK